MRLMKLLKDSEKQTGYFKPGGNGGIGIIGNAPDSSSATYNGCVANVKTTAKTRTVVKPHKVCGNEQKSKRKVYSMEDFKCTKQKKTEKRK